MVMNATTRPPPHCDHTTSTQNSTTLRLTSNCSVQKAEHPNLRAQNAPLSSSQLTNTLHSDRFGAKMIRNEFVDAALYNASTCRAPALFVDIKESAIVRKPALSGYNPSARGKAPVDSLGCCASLTFCVVA
uniref:Uncharacterized protein n=1 Tax=Haptolina brevifila TaxID=156173 RepID=A0A7S2JJI7_9EUKA|mmetsp:Transcript_82876/g.165424  ORF Transcript_82876/g.165424 Transcript_82876/m.165424 type:complete len:131 (+) Transcript_82876:472-864(+)